MNSYSSYSCSKIDWIGVIPSHWKLMPLRYTALGKGCLFIDGDWIESKNISSEGIKYLTTGNVGPGYYKEQGSGFITEETFRELNCTEVFPGDLLISRLNEPIARTCIVPELHSRIVTAVDNVIYRPNPQICEKRYVCYWLNNAKLTEHANILARGATMHRISRTILGHIPVLLPPLNEQSLIADYLDKECSNIDVIIAKEEKRLNLLRELRKSTVTNLLTNGLVKSVAPKATQIPSMSSIPSHWKVCQIRRVLVPGKDGIKIGPFGSSLTGKVSFDGDYKVYGQWNIIGHDFNAGDGYISEDTYNSLIGYRVTPGDVLISMMGTVGKCAIIPDGIEDGIMDSHVVKARLNQKLIDKEYFELLYDKDASDVVFSQINSVKKGSIMDGLNSSLIKSLKICLPPIEEQVSIVSVLKEKTHSIDESISKAEKQLKLLREYKQSIITEVVTGKRKVC